jgi:uncharacterized protein YidB (DUF937 family)
MGLLDMLGNGGRRGGGGMSPMTMALVGLLAYRTLKGKGRLADMLGTNRPGVGGTGARPGGPLGGLGGMAGMGGLGALLGGGALSGGLKDLLDRFRETGQENKAQSWVAAGDNEPIEASELAKALGDERIDWLAEQTGMSREELLAKLSSELPSAVNELTPDGHVPTDDELEQRLNKPA